MKEIKDYEKACEAIASKFVKKYFKNSYPDSFWVSDDVGGVFYVNTYYFSIDRMILALEHKATFKQLLDYYDMELEIAMSGKKVFGKRNLFNFENYLKYPKNFVIETKDGKMNFRIQ